MKNLFKIYPAILLSAYSATSSLNAAAADSSGAATPSKGVIIAVMIVIFILTAIIAGFVSFRLRSASLRKKTDEKSSDKETKE